MDDFNSHAQAEESGSYRTGELLEASREEQEAELYDGQPVMHLSNDLYMMFDDPDYWG